MNGDCLCATRPGYDREGNETEYIYAMNTQCPVDHTEEELKYVTQIDPRSYDHPAWKAWYGV